jgi:hypothetical protein
VKDLPKFRSIDRLEIETACMVHAAPRLTIGSDYAVILKRFFVIVVVTINCGSEHQNVRTC